MNRLLSPYLIHLKKYLYLSNKDNPILSRYNKKNNIYDYLDLFRMWFRDVLLFKATKDVDGLIFREELNATRERAAVSSYEGIERILDAIQTAELRLRANVNFELVMELLFLTIREN